MSTWREDFTACTLEEILRWQALNRAWSKELRLKTTTLVKRRLAKDISLDDYLANRKVAAEESVECQRRAFALNVHLAGRRAG
jgi:hypothetical protein